MNEDLKLARFRVWLYGSGSLITISILIYCLIYNKLESSMIILPILFNVVSFIFHGIDYIKLLKQLKQLNNNEK